MIARFATTRRYLGEERVGQEGKMTTALGEQEWLRSAARGEMETPMLERWGEVREKELEVNCAKGLVKLWGGEEETNAGAEV